MLYIFSICVFHLKSFFKIQGELKYSSYLNFKSQDKAVIEDSLEQEISRMAYGYSYYFKYCSNYTYHFIPRMVTLFNAYS